MKGKLIFTSFGLTTSIGREVIGAVLEAEKTDNKKIFLFHEPYYSTEQILVNACMGLGFRRENIVLSGEEKTKEEILLMDYIYVGEGNTFHILKLLREKGLDETINKAFENGTTYIGASAGGMISGVDIEEAYLFDRNDIRMGDLTGLNLFDGIVLPHFSREKMQQHIEDEPWLAGKYKNIFCVADDDILVLEN